MKILDFKINWTWWVILLITVLTLPSFRTLLRPGYFPMHDDMQAMRLFEMHKCITDFQIPCRWVPDMGYGYGYPQFNYYPPLPYYVMEVMHLLGLSILDSIKAGFILSLILSAVVMFMFLKEILSRWAGFLGALFYTYAPIRASDIFSRGAMGEAWSFIFLPLIFYGGVKLSSNKLGWIWLSLGVSGLLTSHNPTALIFIPLSAIMLGFYYIYSKKWQLVIKLASGYLLGLGLASFFTLPAILEIGYAHTETLKYGYFDYRAHFSSLRQLFASTHFGYGSSELGSFDDQSFSLGILHWIVAAATFLTSFILLLKKRQEKNLVFLVICGLTFLAAAFMMHSKSTFIWEKLPILSYLQFPWRFLVITNFILSILVGAILYFINLRSMKIIICIIFGLLAILLNASFFQPRIWYDIDDRIKFSGELWEKQLTISIFDYLPKSAKAPPAQKAQDKPFLIKGQANIDNVTIKSNLYKFSLASDQPVKASIPIYNFPGWQLYANDKPLMFNQEGDLGLITFDLPKGTYQIKAIFGNTLIRTIGNLTTVISLLVILALSYGKIKTFSNE